MWGRFALTLAALSALATQPSFGAKVFTMAPRSGAPAEIVLGRSATTIEKHAARELASYVSRMSGSKLRVAFHPSASCHSAVLIGRPDTNPFIADLVRQGKVEMSPGKPGLDGFVIKTVTVGEKSYLILGGSQDRSSLYAVYDFLERFCHVGFFWDCERVPGVKELEFDAIDISSRPRFEDRQYFQGCAQSYSAWYWGWPDWKREIDWMAKKKFNVLSVFLGREMADYEAMKALGVEPPQLSTRAKQEHVLARKVIEYAHSIGIRTVTPGTIGQVEYEQGELSRRFKAKYPNAKYIEVEPGVAWVSYQHRLLLDPSDPLWVRLVSERMRQFERLYGTGSSIYNFDPLANENRPGATPEEQSNLNATYAKSVVAAIRSVCPTGKWVMSGWAFYDREYWTPERRQSFLSAIPEDMLLINDLTGKYKELNYYDGRSWGYTVLHAFGGNTQLHGNARDLLADMQRVATEDCGAKCNAFYLSPEIVRHNTFYYDLAARLGWNPRDVKLDDFMRDYALRRWGLGSADRMLECLTELTRSVYGPINPDVVYYQVLPSMSPKVERYASRCQAVSSLKKALDIALAQPGSLASDNDCYNRDLVDIGKEYLGSLSTQAYLDLLSAYKNKDRPGFDAAAKRMRASLDGVQEIVSLCRDYCLAEEIARAGKAPYKMAPQLAAVDIRGRYTLVEGRFEAYDDTLLDYARKDMYELIKYYYRPRVEVLINHLDECLRTNTEASDEDMAVRWKGICRDFVYRSPLAPLLSGWPNDVAAKVRGILSDVERACL